MLQVYKNQISLGKWIGGTAQLRILEGTMDWCEAMLVVKQNFL